MPLPSRSDRDYPASQGDQKWALPVFVREENMSDSAHSSLLFLSYRKRIHGNEAMKWCLS